MKTHQSSRCPVFGRSGAATLLVRVAATCIAVGVAPGWAAESQVPGWVLHSSGFEEDGGGFVANLPGSWNWGRSPGVGGAHGGERIWGTGLEGGYGPMEDGTLMSPVLDLTSAADGAGFQLRWWQQLVTEAEFDLATVEVSSDGGVTWDVRYGPVSGSVSPSWARKTITLGAEWAAAGFRYRFRLRSDGSVQADGFRIDDVELVSIQYQVGGGAFDAGGGLVRSADGRVNVDASLGGWVGESGFGEGSGAGTIELVPGLPLLREDGRVVPLAMDFPFRLRLVETSSSQAFEWEMDGANPGFRYRLETSGSLGSPWREAGPEVVPAAGVSRLRFAVPPDQGQAFFRVRATPQ